MDGLARLALAGQFVLGGRFGSPLLAGARVGGWLAREDIATERNTIYNPTT
jgi:hypothetical protein